MFIETVPQKNLFAPAERDIRFACQNIALLRSAGRNFSNLSYKHLAALRPGRMATFVARTLETGH